MTYDAGYLGSNLNRRSQKAAEDFGAAVAQIRAKAAQAGALGGSRTYLQFIDAGLAILSREAPDSVVRALFLTDLAHLKRFDMNTLKETPVEAIYAEAEMLLEQSRIEQKTAKSSYAAPHICYQKPDGFWYIMQGCCNHWNCPRCGHIRAREEYGRIVQGAKDIEEQGKPMYFWTLTCRGKELSSAEAEKGYLKWTNLLLTKTRAATRRSSPPTSARACRT
jgi:hypothetical protein